MNKFIRTTVLFVFLLLYALVISYYSGNIIYQDSYAYSGNHPHSDVQNTLISKNLLCHTSQLKTSVSGATIALNSSSKNSYNDNSANSKNSEHKFLNRFQQYLVFIHNTIVRYRQNDLIFPFHYFW